VLRAKLKGADVLAPEVEKGPTYRCPDCGQAVVLKKGWIRTHHFAHKVLGRCELEGQSQEHLEIKLMLGELLGAETSAYEVRVGGVMTDFYFASSHVAVKIQASATTYKKWHETTQALCSAGCVVLWVWGRYAFGSEHVDADERRIPAVVQKCHHEYWGRVYVCLDDHLDAVHFDPAEPRESDYGTYYPKRLRRVRTRAVTHDNLRPHTEHGAVTKTFKLMHLDTPWWKK
jgi:competence protein CoiA